MTKLDKMTQEKWNAMSRLERDKIRDCSELTKQLVGLEGCRVEVVGLHATKPRRFNVGKSTGWKPCHLELANAASSGGSMAAREYASVRVIRYA